MGWRKLIGVFLGMTLVFGMQNGPTSAEEAGAHRIVVSGASAGRILVLGDSLSAEYGLPRGSGWVSLISQRLAKADQAYQIRNASISGDTTGNGLQRLPPILEEFQPELVILQLGANDGLRGLPVNDMKSNLSKIISLIKAGGARVLLLGQHIPPNYGKQYADRFHAVYGELAQEHGVELVPFMLDAIALDATMFQPDGLHPTVEAQESIVDTVWPKLEEVLAQMDGYKKSP